MYLNLNRNKFINQIRGSLWDKLLTGGENEISYLSLPAHFINLNERQTQM